LEWPNAKNKSGCKNESALEQKAQKPPQRERKRGGRERRGGAPEGRMIKKSAEAEKEKRWRRQRRRRNTGMGQEAIAG